MAKKRFFFTIVQGKTERFFDYMFSRLARLRYQSDHVSPWAGHGYPRRPPWYLGVPQVTVMTRTDVISDSKKHISPIGYFAGQLRDVCLPNCHGHGLRRQQSAHRDIR